MREYYYHHPRYRFTLLPFYPESQVYKTLKTEKRPERESLWRFSGDMMQFELLWFSRYKYLFWNQVKHRTGGRWVLSMYRLRHPWQIRRSAPSYSSSFRAKLHQVHPLPFFQLSKTLRPWRFLPFPSFAGRTSLGGLSPSSSWGSSGSTYSGSMWTDQIDLPSNRHIRLGL